MVLTCSHLFDGKPDKIFVEFADGRRFGARLVDRDETLDLAAVAIRRPEIEPIAVGEADPAGELAACGYGQKGEFRSVQGSVVGEATATGAAFSSLMIGCEVRPGDSGGAVLDAAGRLVGVVWGKHDGLTYAMCGQPVREFVARALGRRDSLLASPIPEIDWQTWSKEIDSRLRALDAKKQDKGEYLQPGDLASLATRAEMAAAAKEWRAAAQRAASEAKTRIEALRDQLRADFDERIAASRQGFLAGLSPLKLMAGAVGLGGPVAAAMAAVVIAGRRWKRRGAGSLPRGGGASFPAASFPHSAPRPITVDSPPPAQRVVPETHYVSVETDSFARAHQWASEQVARKYPGATEVLVAQDSLIKQHLAGQQH
jgi:hypothetical protein